MHIMLTNIIDFINVSLLLGCFLPGGSIVFKINGMPSMHISVARHSFFEM